MKLKIREFARLTGVSVRTLHFYDEIGLLKPSSVDEQNGYRFYDEQTLMRMQEILFYRELNFSLKEIRMILSSPDYDKQNALKEQKHLLTLKKERLERIISALDSAMKGEIVNMNVFDNSEFEEKRNEYAKEAREKWGDTAAYKEYAEKNRRLFGGQAQASKLRYGRENCRICRLQKKWICSRKPKDAGTCEKVAGFYNRKLLHLYKRNSCRTRRNVCCR